MDDLLVQPSDFESMEVTVGLTNTTTRTEAKKGAKILVVEVRDRGLVLEVPVRTCAQGHNLVLSLVVTLPDKKTVEFKTTAKVESREQLPDGSGDRIEVMLTQFNEKDWAAFCRLFSGRQQEIERFFAAAKGLA